MKYPFEAGTRQISHYLRLWVLSLCRVAACSREHPKLERWEPRAAGSPENAAAYWQRRSLSESELAHLNSIFDSEEATAQDLFRLLGYAQVTRKRRRENRIGLKLIVKFPMQAAGNLVRIWGGGVNESQHLRIEVARLWDEHLAKDPENLVLILQSARIDESPTLGSFGPNMRLASEILAEDRRDVVLECFDLCRDFWDRPKLDEWSKAVHAGIAPDFGANLVYGL